MSSTEPGASRDRTVPTAVNPTQPNPTQPNPTQPNPTQPNPAQTDHVQYDHDRPDHDRPDRGGLRREQKQRFGGIKWGSAFFGWLTAVGTAVLLSALVTGIGGALGLSAAGGPGQAAGQVGQAAQDPGAAQTAGLAGAIVAAVVLFVAYYCGGYVAGRMARFDGLKQGVAVWVWTVVITIVAAVLAAIAGAQFDVLSRIGGLPTLPVDGSAVTATAVIGVLVALAVILAGAILGGLAGMRFHRKIDRADLSGATHG